MMNTKKPMSLTGRIIFGMIAGILTGFAIRILFGDEGFVNTYVVNGLFEVGGKIFIASLQMLVVPLVFVSLVCGTSSLKDLSTLGRMGGKTLAFYIITTCVAITLALTMGTLFQPGAGADLTAASSFQSAEAPSLGQVIIDMFPKNPINAMAEGKTLQIIVFAILFGIAISASGKPGERIAAIFQDLNEVIMKLVALLMNIAPYGVFFLMAKLFTGLGLGAIMNLAGYFLVLAGTLLLHGLVTYSVMLKTFTGLSPKLFLKKMEDAVMFAFSTASSNATIPVTMETAKYRMGVDNKIASFTVPLALP